MNRAKGIYRIMLLLAIGLALVSTSCQQKGEKVEKIGVLYLIHGGMDTHKTQYMWDAAVLQFSFDHNHPVHKFVIWKPKFWPAVLDTNVSDFTLKYLRMYEFEYKRIGGRDAYHSLSEQQLADIKTELDVNPYGLAFEVDWAGFQCADRLEHYPYPRFIYYGPDGPGKGANCTYCGEKDPGGPWPDCDPERYNVDGPVERLLKKGVSRIIAVDWMMGGPRYSKTYDVVQMAKRALDDWNSKHGTSIPLLWINDYSNLMERSYPTKPAGWTASKGLPTEDSHVLLNGSTNPIASDSEVAALYVEAIEDGMSAAVPDVTTGVIILNHSMHADNNELFDPKINDTLIINKNIKARLLDRHPTMNQDNIIGAWLGKREKNPENGLLEHNREMRAEVYGNAWLYESDKQLPGEEWGYRCWDALEYLKNRGVRHIVIGVVHLATSSVLDMVELPNQIGREIGIKTWAKWEKGDFKNYPEVGHPFADYWGMWAYTDCGEWQLKYESGTSKFKGGTTLTGKTSGAKGVIKWLDGEVTAGALTLKEVSGAFQGGEIITDNKGGSARAGGPAVMTSKQECCFEMGGCGDPLRPYPPPRQTPLNQARSDLDPSVVYDMSDYGHLGYDPAKGPPDPNKPVQAQYTGTWAMFSPPDDDPRVGKLLARHVLNAAVNPMVYITNGEVTGITTGESVTFKAHVTGGKPGYTYEWSIKKEETGKWLSMGGNNSNWTWKPVGEGAGTYAIRCRVTDAQEHTGEVSWKNFVISSV
ncbi:MAG: hypothetical protein V3R78_03655 [Thermodesulfobacteriota bacterium]